MFCVDRLFFMVSILGCFYFYVHELMITSGINKLVNLRGTISSGVAFSEGVTLPT